MDILRREIIYIWYYFSIQLEQVFFYWVLGMVIGSAISVFGKGKIHSAFQALGKKKLGALGLILPVCLESRPRCVCTGQSPLQRPSPRKA